MWDRLIAVVEEQALALMRTGFSTSTREAGDLSAGVFDLSGAMLAQAVTGTPGHINSMARAVYHFLDRFPAKTMKEGDIYLTNDPWKGTGHLHDFTFVTPTFRQGKMVALFASTCHVVDIGGRGMGADARQVYEEGLYIPLMHFAREGKVDQTLTDIVAANVREPVQVVGDLYSLATCNEIGCRRLIEMMDEFGIDDLDRLGAHILAKSKQASLEAISKITPGEYKFSMTVDGYDKPIDLVATMKIGPTGIDVDFTGTSGVSAFGINVPHCYTEAYASFGVKCIVSPKVPNNEGSLEVIRITAPEGCIVNAKHPAPVAARSTIGHMLPDVMFGCLIQALPDGVPAEGTSCLWNLRLMGGLGRAELTSEQMATATPSSGTLVLAAGTSNVTATIADTAGNSASDTTTGELVIDTTAPAVLSVNSTTADGAYKAGQTILIQVQLSETVTALTTLGSPTLTLNAGRSATFVSAVGNVLNFTYTVQSGDTAADLNATALVLNGGSIKDTAGNNLTLTLP
ncbi:MAG: hydantoinase B/oxoprolinase family protein, partial [Enhydrobacter sp.]